MPKPKPYTRGAGPLTAKAERFCEEYVVDLNTRRAAIAAGYTEASAAAQGRRLLTQPNVKARLDELKAERSKRTATDADWVLVEARKLYERCMQEIKPALDRKGKPLVDEDGNALFTFNAAGAARALEIAGRHVQVRAFEERVVHSIDEDEIVRILHRGRDLVARQHREKAIEAEFEPVALPAPPPSRKPRTPSPIASGGAVVQVVPGNPLNEPRPNARKPKPRRTSGPTNNPAVAALHAGRARNSRKES